MTIFVSFLNICFINESVNIWLLHHEVPLLTCGACKLNWTWRLVTIEIRPLLSYSLKTFEHTFIKFDESLCDDGLVLTVSSFNTHHRGKWATSSNPVPGIRVTKVLHT